MRFAIGLFTLAAHVTVAHADDPARLQARQHAEQLAAEGRDDPSKAVECGKAYLDLYNANVAVPDGDELLYNAGVCFESGKSIGVAITTFEQLRTRYRASKLLLGATIRVGSDYARIGFLDRAAERFEDYAKRYAGEKNAVDALLDALAMRRALGDDAKQIEDTKFLVKIYKPTATTMQAFFALTPIYERQSRDAAIRHLREYLQMYGPKGGNERVIAAYAKIGELLWKQSCPVPLVDGLCIKLVRVQPQTRGLPTHCGPASPTTITVVPRNERQMKEALASFAMAVKTFDKLQSRDPAIVHAYSMARIAMADTEAERYLGVAFPTGLDFSATDDKVKQASTTRFTEYMATKQRIGDASAKAYGDVFAMHDPIGSVVSAARLGMLSQSFANDLGGAEIPKDVRTNPSAADKIDAFCKKLVEVSEPIKKAAVDAYDACLQKVGETGVTDPWSKQCESERVLLAPAPAIATTELVAEPLALAMPIIAEPPISPTKQQPKAFADALAVFATNDGPLGFAKPVCQSLAAKFDELATKHRLADAHFMAGLTYERCGNAPAAKLAYDRALAIQSHPAASSNKGALAWRAGRPDEARKIWEAALAIDGKLYAAHANLAAIGLLALNGLPVTDPKRKPLEADIQLHVSSALGIDDRDATPYVLLAIAALESAPTKRIELARYFLQKASRLDDKSPYVGVARGVLAHREGQAAFLHFKTAAEAKHAPEEAHLDLGLQYLAMRHWSEASVALAAVQTKSYDLLVARGVAARGLGKLADAEARYTEAQALDASRSEALFDLGVLWKDYVAPHAADPKATYKKAAEVFRRVGSPRAKRMAEECDRAIAMP